MKLSSIVFFCLLGALFATGIAFSQAPPVSANSTLEKGSRYITLPNGASFPMLEGETPERALAAAVAKYPEAFGFFPEGALYDNDYFNSCVLKDLDKAKTELAVAQLRQACEYKSTPKTCRSLAADRDRAQCVKSCKGAGYFSNTVGACSKG